MFQKNIFVVLLLMLIVGFSEGGLTPAFAPLSKAEAAEVPSFLQVGKTYDLGSTKMTVLEIDKEAGWIKVQYIDNNREQVQWLNLAHVSAIRAPTQ